MNLKVTAYLATALFLFSIQSSGQKLPKFGKIPSDLMSMQTYEKDSSAEAVILYDIGVINLKYNSLKDTWQTILTRSTAIKILSKEAYEWADQEIELYHSENGKEIVSKLRGLTHNLVDGKLVTSKLEKESIFIEETNKFWNTQKFTMPDVKVGSVIEFNYTVESDFYFNLRSWNFQHKIPIIKSELTTNIPEFFDYRLITQGYFPFTKNEKDNGRDKISFKSNSKSTGAFTTGTSGFTSSRTSFSEFEFEININTLGVENLPAIGRESYISNINNYRVKVDFELQSTYFNNKFRDYRSSWESLNKQFLENQYFGKSLENISFIKDELSQISKTTTETEKVAQVVKLIRSKIKWDGFYAKYVETTLNSALKEGTGSVAEINLAITAALRQVGIQADPVLASTRNNGVVRKSYPLSKQFNYVLTLAKVDGKEVLLDGTSDLPIGYIPTKCINGAAWVVSSPSGRWISLSDIGTHRVTYKADVKIEDNGLNTTLDVQREHYAAFNSKDLIREKGEQARADEFSKDHNWEISSYSFENVDESYQPLKEAYEFETKKGLEKAGNLILLKPLLIGDEEENPFKVENRKYPVDFIYPIYSAYLGTIEIPEGYQVEELPASVAISLPDKKGRFIFSLVQKDNIINVTNMVDIKRGLFLPEDYPYLKAFFSKIVDKHSESIVLKKL